MSFAYDIGFTKKPELTELDSFMKSIGFEVEPRGQRQGMFTRVYVFYDASTPREIELFYNDQARDIGDKFGERGKNVQAIGCLQSDMTEPAHPSLEERLKIIEQKKVGTEHYYYRHVACECLKFYESALTLKDHYDA